MTKIRLKYVQAFTDRHGRTRYYFRRPNHERRTLPGLPGSAEFMEAYQAALSGAPTPREIGAERTTPGSFNALIIAYYASADYKTLKPITQRGYRNVIERWRVKHGPGQVAALTAPVIRRMFDALSDRPGAAYGLRRIIRILMKFAVDYGYRTDNPARDIRKVKTTSTGYRSWTEADIAQFEAWWPQGSRARLALHLLLHTAQRRSDVVEMGRQHVRGASIHVAQNKSNGKTRLALPIHPTLAESLREVPAGQMIFIQSRAGAPMTPEGFGNWFADCAKKAGLPPGSSAHGLRKAAARRLAEAGCTALQIQAVTGHKNLAEVALYTAASDQEHLAKQAMALQKMDEARTQSVKPRLGFDNLAKKAKKIKPQ